MYLPQCSTYLELVSDIQTLFHHPKGLSFTLSFTDGFQRSNWLTGSESISNHFNP